jgi:enoyl-CoA hydratase/carnithine racemase
MTDWQMITMDKDGPLAIVTLANPPLNVLHPQMAAELDDCFTGLATDPDTVVAIITGQGERAFCAGFDIKEFPRMMEPGGAERLADQLHTSLLKIQHVGKPTIAAVNGLALGGGLEVAMACDLRVVAANAQLGQPEIKLGLLPGAGGTQRLPRLVGAGRAMELMYLGDPIGAEEAYRIGLANRIVPQGEALSSAKGTGKKIAGMAGVALRYIQMAVNRGLNTTLEAGLKIEADEPVGTGTFSHVSGRLAWTYPVDIHTAWPATLRALDKLNIQVQDKAVDGLGGTILAQRADQTKVSVTLEPVSKRATRVSIKIGAFGNREQSENIHALIRQELNL